MQMMDNYLAAGWLRGSVINDKGGYGEKGGGGEEGHRTELKPGRMPFSWERFIGFRTKRIVSVRRRLRDRTRIHVRWSIRVRYIIIFYVYYTRVCVRVSIRFGAGHRR